MKLKALHEDILGDVKRKLKGQVSLSDNIRRVAKQELKDAELRFELIDDIISGKKSSSKSAKQVIKTALKALQKAQKDLDRIK